MTIQEFIKVFCKRRGISVRVLKGGNRSVYLVNYRAELVNLLKNDWEAKTGIISKLINKDPAAVRNLIKRGVKVAYKEPKNPLGLI